MSIRSSIARTAFETLRSNPSHTLMSISGLVIGVAALVGVLSLADGIEDFARQQVNSTTDLQSINLSISTTEMVDGVRVPRSVVPLFDVEGSKSLQKELLGSASVVLYARRNALISLPNDTLRTAAQTVAVSGSIEDLISAPLIEGRSITQEDVEMGASVATISKALAERLQKSLKTEHVVGLQLYLDSALVDIVGVIDPANNAPIGVLVPFSTTTRVPSESTASIMVKANLVEDIPNIKERIYRWADAQFDDGKEVLVVQTNEMRVEQVQKGVRLFKVIMGLITGIAVLVGGVGIMNVLMMSVKERTKEIGVRKAVGARKNDIVFQFMIESITISSVGCLVGLITGLVAVYAVTPIVRIITDVPFQAGFSLGTLLVIAIVAAVIGITFGTYPAYSAAKLNPVDAIRYE